MPYLLQLDLGDVQFQPSPIGAPLNAIYTVVTFSVLVTVEHPPEKPNNVSLSGVSPLN